MVNSKWQISTKKGFTIVEVTVVFLLILGVTFLILPRSLDNTRQAKLISKWSQTYAEIEYMFSAIKAQQEGSIIQYDKKLKKESEKSFLLDIIRPYLRITSKADSKYKQYSMDKKEITSNSFYYFDTFYQTSLDEILGLKWVDKNCENNNICAIMSFDINGLNPPNAWGYDVFGINIFKNKIEPIGRDMLPDVLKFDCSKHGSGVGCSYYYLIGGRFD